MRYGVLLATLLVCCCVNHLRAAALEVQPGVQLKQQLESSSRESVQAIVPLHAAIGSSRTQLAARSFRRTRKLLTTAVRTQRRNLRQLFIGGPITGGYTLYNAGSGTWWQVGNGATCCWCVILTAPGDTTCCASISVQTAGSIKGRSSLWCDV